MKMPLVIATSGIFMMALARPTSSISNDNDEGWSKRYECADCFI